MTIRARAHLIRLCSLLFSVLFFSVACDSGAVMDAGSSLDGDVATDAGGGAVVDGGGPDASGAVDGGVVLTDAGGGAVLDGGGPDASGAVDGGMAAELYVPDRTYTAEMRGRMRLLPPHRRGPNEISPDALSDLPLTVWVPEGAAGPLPLVIWSHGGGSRTSPGSSGPNWGMALASGGYAVVAMHHMARTEVDRVRNVCAPLGIAAGDCDEVTWTAYYESTDRAKDAVAVIDAIPTIEAELGIELDEARIAVAGHSGGTNAPLYLAGASRNALPPSAGMEELFALSDERPRAFLAMSPQLEGWRMLSAVVRPVLSATGAGDLEPAERAAVHSALGPGDKIRVYLNSDQAHHSLFNLEVRTGPLEPAFRAFLASAATAFLDAHVKGDARAASWLRGEAPAALLDALVAPDPTLVAWDLR